MVSNNFLQNNLNINSLIFNNSNKLNQPVTEEALDVMVG